MIGFCNAEEHIPQRQAACCAWRRLQAWRS